MRSTTCPVCGRNTADCHLDTITFTISPQETLMSSKYRSTERVYGEVNGVRTLLYPVGAPIPEDEARRQGLIGHAESAAVTEDDIEDKSVGVTKPVKPARVRTSAK